MRVRAYVPTEFIILHGSWTPFGAPKEYSFFLDQINILDGPKSLITSFALMDVMCMHEVNESLLVLCF